MQRGWDQFAVNERITGVSTRYNDELYTTKISDKRFTDAQKAAEGEGPVNKHWRTYFLQHLCILQSLD